MAIFGGVFSSPFVHMTVAVERDQPGLEQAVFAGTIRNTDEMDVVSITRELQGLAQATEETNERWRLLKRIVETLPPFLARWLISAPRLFPASGSSTVAGQ